MHQPMKKDFAPLLLGKDLRTNARNKEVINSVRDQKSFDELFSLIFHHERPLVMRAADAVEKITAIHREFLIPHKPQIMSLLKSAMNNEFQWHIAQLIPRIDLNEEELKEAWAILTYWAKNPNESKIVRVNSLQALFDLSRPYPELRADFEKTLHGMEHEPIPSIQARIKKLKKLLEKSK